jgi:hypothetical protein
MYAIMHKALALASLLAATASAQTLGEPIVEVPEVLVRITWYEHQRDLVAARGRHTNVIERSLTGYAVLLRDRKTGQFVCEVHVVRPIRWRGRQMEVVGHEIMHCFGYRHD